MIPVELVIAGLYSYQEEQTIDFENLTSAGLFGVFGAVGSGKSSILEAITFALYNQVERLNSRDNRNYNMMNLRSNKSYIKFTFLNAANNKYKIVRSFRRNSKRHDDVKPEDAVLYQWIDNVWQPLPSTDVEPIIGLSYDNFKRTIIIPQGQFKEFIELGAKDRTQMMKEIFQLHRFDLQGKTAALYTESKSQLDQLAGSLKTFEAVSEQVISQAQENLAASEKELNELQNNFCVKEAKFNQLCALKSDMDSKQQLTASLQELLLQSDFFEERAKRLAKFETVSSVFAARVQNKKRIASDLADKKQAQLQASQELSVIKNDFEVISSQLAVLKIDYEQLPQKRELEQDLQCVGRILSLKQEQEKSYSNLKVGSEFVVNAENAIAELKKNASAIATQLIQLKTQLPNPMELLEVEQWYAAFENTCALEQSLALRKAPLLQQQLSFQNDIGLDVDIPTAISNLDAEAKKLDVELESLIAQRSHLIVQQQLQHFADAIEEGKPCPLCGALDHPAVLTIAQVDEDIKACEHKIVSIKTALNEIQEQKNNINKIGQQLLSLKEQLMNIAKEEQELRNKKEQQINDFKWAQFDAHDKSKFGSVKAAFEQMTAQIKQLEENQSTSHEALEKALEKLQKANQRLEELRSNITALEAQMVQNKQLIKQINLNDWLEASVEAVQEEYEKCKIEHDKLAADYQKYNDKYSVLAPKLAAQSAKVDGLQEAIQTLELNLSVELEQLHTLMQQYEIATEADLEELLDCGLNIVKERAAIEAYTVEIKSLRTSIARLEDKLADIVFDKSAFEVLEQEIALWKENISNQSNHVAVLKSNLATAKAALKEKEDLMREYENCSRRVENLNILKRMFDRAGFVEFASTSLLRQLCEQANIRFHRLTRNQLSLQMNDNNDFEIIDYLNEGKARSVKTLSGGQAFQVSLSLALALAESVQSNAKAEKNFFFIDEGFGTQDAESVNIVFETLMSLQKENRIVGIISHVEELKSRIPVSLNVVKDAERGSQIVESWSS
jgi:exonuclease SbcC